jgi:hypothetical protein
MNLVEIFEGEVFLDGVLSIFSHLPTGGQQGFEQFNAFLWA